MEHSKRIKKGTRIKLVNSDYCEKGSLLSRRLLKFLAINGYDLCDENSDIYIVNTCCVVSKLRDEAVKMIDLLRARNEKPILLFGCFADIDTSAYKGIIKLASKNVEMADDLFEHGTSITKINSSLVNSNFTEYQKYGKLDLRRILISQGCDNNCSYCTIKKAKGKTKSRPIREIIKEILDSPKKNEEIFLIADDCGSYGTDINTNIVELIKSILSFKKDITIAIYYLFPQTLIQYEDDFIDFIKAGRISYINIPIQSGSNRILKLMNRNYDINILNRIIEKIKAIKPNIWLFTHIMINFPTETMADLKKSLKVTKIFNETMFFDYSENKLTASYRIKPKLDPNIRESRIQHVNKYIIREKNVWKLGTEV